MNKYNFGIKGLGKNLILVIFKEIINLNDYKGWKWYYGLIMFYVICKLEVLGIFMF